MYPSLPEGLAGRSIRPCLVPGARDIRLLNKMRQIEILQALVAD